MLHDKFPVPQQTNLRSTLSRRALIRAGGLSLAGLALGALAPEAEGADLPAPRFLREWGKRGKAEGEFDPPIGIAVNRADELFVTDFRNARVQKFDTEGKLLAVFPVAEQPGGIAVDEDGNFYVGHFTDKLTLYSPQGKQIGDWGRSGKGDGEFQQPGGMAFGPDGLLYVADETNHRVQKFDREGRFRGKWGEYGTGPGQFGGNTSEKVRTGGPQFLAFDSQGNVYTTEASVGRIQKFTPDGKYLLSWGDNGTGPGGFGGRPRNLPGPIAICADRQDRLWISATNHRVQQFTAEGKFLRGFGAQGTAPGEFHTPHGLVLDRKGRLYVVDAQNCRIQKFEVPES
jgi:sugar lactone lactonase YvrE